LLDKRVRLALLIGIVFYASNSLEPWFTFHDIRAVYIQLGTAFLMVCIAGVAFTDWGSHHRLCFFNLGFLLAAAGFEAIVCYENAFESSYSAGFPTFFAIDIGRFILHRWLRPQGRYIRPELVDDFPHGGQLLTHGPPKGLGSRPRANSMLGPLRLSPRRTRMLGPSTGVRILPFGKVCAALHTHKPRWERPAKEVRRA
jgi:hypothetical protein